MSTRRFEFVDGASSKFWEVEPRGSRLAIRWGKKGTAGQSQDKTFADAAAATKELNKLVADKTKKGYAEVGGTIGADAIAPGNGDALAKPAAEDAVKPAARDAVKPAAKDAGFALTLASKVKYLSLVRPVGQGGELLVLGWDENWAKKTRVECRDHAGAIRWKTVMSGHPRAVHADDTHVVAVTALDPDSRTRIEWLDRTTGVSLAHAEVAQSTDSLLVAGTLLVQRITSTFDHAAKQEVGAVDPGRGCPEPARRPRPRSLDVPLRPRGGGPAAGGRAADGAPGSGRLPGHGAAGDRALRTRSSSSRRWAATKNRSPCAGASP